MARNKRIGRQSAPAGWDFVRQRLKTRTIYFFSSCIDTIRTLPALVHDPDKPGDCMSEGVEDHLPDCVRYGCSSRPWVESKGGSIPPAEYEAEAGESNTVIIRPPDGGWLAELVDESGAPERRLSILGRRRID